MLFLSLFQANIAYENYTYKKVHKTLTLQKPYTLTPLPSFSTAFKYNLIPNGITFKNIFLTGYIIITQKIIRSVLMK